MRCLYSVLSSIVHCGVFVQFLGLRGTGAVLPYSPRTTAAMQVPGFRLDFWVLGGGGGGGKGAEYPSKTIVCNPNT